MSDSAFTNNTIETATDLGTLGFAGNAFEGRTTSRIFDFDSVGLPAVEAPGGVAFTTDVADFFTFDPYDLASIRVNFNADTVGDFTNFVYFLPVSGVSKVDGALIGSWSGGEDANFFASLDGTPVVVDLDPESDIVLDPLLDLSSAVYSVNHFTGGDAVWTLTGAPVVVSVLGLHIETSTDEFDNTFEVYSDVDYRFTIEPQSGVVPDPDPIPAPDPVPPSMYFSNDVTNSQTLTGGAGLDFFEARGSLDAFTIDFQSDGSITFTEPLRPDRVDTLIDIERVELIGGNLAFDTDGNAGQAYRLYQAAFDRQPDAEGLGFWIDNFDDGNVDLVAMASYFMQSDEFAQRYGNPQTLSDFDFLTLLYANVLDRTPDGPGFDFWTDQQANGLSRPEMLQYFSESVENFDNVADAIAGGIFYL